jgi:glucose-6-phosphate dehydrogenase assembly protein OpcA
MARVVATRTWRPATPDAIEPELTSLWSELAQHGAVGRAVMSNLVVYRERTGARAADIDALVGDLPLDGVMAQHPSRVIVLDHERGRPDASSPFAAAVGVALFGPADARYGVEQIAVQSSCADDSLPSIVRRLLRGDVPTSVWWAEDLSRVPPIAAIVDMGRQLLYDSRQWRDVPGGVSALAPFLSKDRGLDLADLNWRRLAPVRRALVHAAGTTDLHGLRDGDVHLVHRPGDEALAWLAVGWLRAQLHESSTASPHIEEAKRADEVLSIAIGKAPAELTLTLESHRVLVTHRGGHPPITVAVPQELEADAVAAELRTLSRTVCLHEAINALVRIFGAT